MASLRDVWVYDPNNLSKPLGGLLATPGITNANFYAMVNIAFLISAHYFIRKRQNGERLPQDQQPLVPIREQECRASGMQLVHGIGAASLARGLT
ncbi:hypothetical protein VTI74DRAFT_5822 [Chaetomium olivicolor]